ncbi:MAG: hypothetical protein N2C12_17205 [Planctomycetales bacterium]
MKKFLDSAVCPKSHQRMQLADQSLIERLNQMIEDGTLKNSAGGEVAHPLDGGLIRSDGEVLYPIQDDIPVLLADQGILLKELDLGNG